MGPLFIFILYFFSAHGWDARLFMEKNMEGPEVYVNGTNCRNMEGLSWCYFSASTRAFQCVPVDNRIKSIITRGRCLRIFEDENCYGRTLALYPGNEYHYDLAFYDFANKVSSIGPCFVEDNCSPPYRRKRQISGNEFCIVRFPGQIQVINNATFTGFANDILRVGQVPGLPIQRPMDRYRGPIVEYQRGYGNRVEYVQARIFRRHINNGSGTTNSTQVYARNMGLSTDVAGHIIARRLGGRGNIEYNIIPQNSHINGGVWREQEGLVADLVLLTGEVIFTVNLNYPNGTSTRPNLIIYKIETFHPNGSYWHVLTNDMINP